MYAHAGQSLAVCKSCAQARVHACMPTTAGTNTVTATNAGAGSCAIITPAPSTGTDTVTATER